MDNNFVQQSGVIELAGEFAAAYDPNVFTASTGVAHCGGGVGPAPTGGLEALLAWVEENKAPESLPAIRRDQAGGVRTRPLCQYPQVAKYKGSGSTDDASNFSCSSGF